MCLLQIQWKLLYKSKSFMEKGTLYQLRNSINRRNVTASAENDFNACDDYFVLVVRCHVLAAAMQYLKMKETTELPIHAALTEELWMESKDKRKDVLQQIVNEIVRKFVDIEVKFNCRESTEADKVQSYACELLSQGLLYMEFSDSIREADGFRVLRCWRYLMLIFKATQRKNYSIEALNIICQYHFFMSQRQSSQLIWSRYINTRGIPGKNIPAGLFMEHLNRICKMGVAHLGANKTKTSLTRTGRCLGVLSQILSNYDDSVGVAEASGSHSSPGAKKDQSVILKQLQ